MTEEQIQVLTEIFGDAILKELNQEKEQKGATNE